jgi:hypothetical protein
VIKEDKDDIIEMELDKECYTLLSHSVGIDKLDIHVRGREPVR